MFAIQVDSARQPLAPPARHGIIAVQPRAFRPASKQTMAKDKPTLADHVEAAERRAAPRAPTRAAGRDGTGVVAWVVLGILSVLLLAVVTAWLRANRLI